jgi:hypothetical protein
MLCGGARTNDLQANPILVGCVSSTPADESKQHVYNKLEQSTLNRLFKVHLATHCYVHSLYASYNDRITLTLAQQSTLPSVT